LSSSPFALMDEIELVYYRGNSGGLWAKDVDSRSSQYLNHWNLGLSLP
jgi:hypothetical protein